MEEATNHAISHPSRYMYLYMRFCNWFGQFYIQIQTLIESGSKHSLNSPHRQRSNIIKIVCTKKKMLSHFQFIG